MPKYQDKVPAAMVGLEGCIRAGDVAVVVNITDGFDNTPRAFCELMSRKTLGKALVRVDF